VDNTGGDDGDVLVRYRRGCFGWDNDATARVEQAGTLCYVVDDHTVSSDDDEGARPVAGRVVCVLQSGIVVVDHR
jgi:hypothetical protein